MLNPRATRNRLGIFLLLIVDILTLLGLFYLAVFIRKKAIPIIFHNIPTFDQGIETYYWIFPLWLIIMVYEGAYSKRFTFWDEVKFLWKSTLLSSVAIFTILFIGKHGEVFSRILILVMSFLSLLIYPFIRTKIKKCLYSIGLMKRKLLIIGAGEAAKTVVSAIKDEPNLGYEVAGFIDDRPQNSGQIEGIRIHHCIDKIERYIKRCSIHDVLIAKPELEKERLTKIINTIQHRVENVLYLPELTGIAVVGTQIRHFFKEEAFLIEIKNNLAQPLNYFSKRLFDYLAGLILFLFLIIPIIVISLLIKLTSKGPAVFRQERIGKNGTTFMCYKFRTMYIDADERLKEILEKYPEAKAEWQKYWKLKNDPRVTHIGKFLRKTSLDELPQIFNVLKGDMSLVGPRPYLPREQDALEDFTEIIHSVPPGITGLWQVSGRSNKTYEERVALDCWYVRNWNLWLDIVILLKTIKVVFKKEGAC